jgi:hypothetical protein|tara:strand:- start:255 stop:479 length:225 start_codon:yes stop_codon:yes gene_type:complete
MGWAKHHCMEIIESNAEEIVNDWNEQNPTNKVEELEQIEEHDSDWLIEWASDYDQGKADADYDAWKDEQMEKSM